MAFILLQVVAIDQMDREQRNRARLYRRTIRDAQNPFAVSEREFRRHFRLSKEAALDLVDAVTPFMGDSIRTTRIPKMLRILSALNFFATGSYQRSAGSNSLVAISQPVVSRNIREFCNIILRHMIRRWLRFPRNDVERNELKAGFVVHHEMPQVIGVVDGTQVAIYPPTELENIYVNRKGYHSLNCQIVCDSELTILNLVTRWPGSSHDTYIWRQSRVGRAMQANFENGDHETRIMDSGYACLPWLLVPLANPRTPQETHYNDTFKQCRSVVERCIGLLKGRFRCLLKNRTLHYNPQIAARIILTCGVLHNVALHYRVPHPEPQWDELDLEALPQPQIPEQQDMQFRNMGQANRQQYIAQYF